MPHTYNSKNLASMRKSLRNNMPQSERILWYYLKGKNIKNYKFRRQYSVGNYILDFYCPKVRLAIEIDGNTHFVDDTALAYNQKRDIFLNEHNIHVIHFTNSDIIENIEVIINTLLNYLP